MSFPNVDEMACLTLKGLSETEERKGEETRRQVNHIVEATKEGIFAKAEQGKYCCPVLQYNHGSRLSKRGYEHDGHSISDQTAKEILSYFTKLGYQIKCYTKTLTSFKELDNFLLKKESSARNGRQVRAIIYVSWEPRVGFFTDGAKISDTRAMSLAERIRKYGPYIGISPLRGKGKSRYGF